MGLTAEVVVDHNQGLTDRQAKFVHEFLANGHNATQAALATGEYSSPASAAATASRWLRNDNVRESVEEALDREGLTPRKITSKLAEIIDAQEDVYDKDGKLVGSKPAYQHQLQAVAQVCKLAGAYAPTESRSLKASLSLKLTEPVAVRRFIARHGRRPTPDELAALQPGQEAGS